MFLSVTEEPKTPLLNNNESATPGSMPQLNSGPMSNQPTTPGGMCGPGTPTPACPPTMPGAQPGLPQMGPQHPGAGGPMHQGPPTSMDSNFMQQQSHIFVFSTRLANEAAEAVLTGQHKNIISFHCEQPGTKKILAVSISSEVNI